MAFLKKPFQGHLPLDKLKDLILVARGEENPDLTLHNVSLVNVLTREIEENQSVLIKHGQIAAVLDASSLASYPKATTHVDLNEAYLAPSFIDSHVHFESSMLTLTNFANAVLPHGTGLVVIDPHEITNVLGSEILRFLSKEIKQLPLDIYMEVPSCVPAAIGLETPANEVTSQTIANLFDDPEIDVQALAELMNYPGVLFGANEILQRILVTRSRGFIVEGHAPGLTRGDLNAYIAAGVISDHESVSPVEGLEKLRRGMTLQIRDGSVASDLKRLVTGLLEHKLNDWSKCVFASDDRHPDDLLNQGHIDHTITKAINLGLDPLLALQIATINAAKHLHLDHFLGSISPGKWANMVAFSKLETIKVTHVFYQGLQVVKNEKLIMQSQPLPFPKQYLNTVALPEYQKKDVILKFDSKSVQESSVKVKIIGAIEKSLLTTTILDNVQVDQNNVFIPDTSKDYLPILVVDRHHNVLRNGKGIVHGFGIKQGAIGSTIAHDTHNIVVTGSDYESIVTAINKLKEQKGGIVVTQHTRVLASLPLPFGGLLSTNPITETANLLSQVREATETIGCKFHNPEMTLAFMALPVIPELKITDKGIVDVNKFQLTSLTVSSG